MDICDACKNDFAAHYTEKEEHLCATCYKAWMDFIGDKTESWVRANLYTNPIAFINARNMPAKEMAKIIRDLIDVYDLNLEVLDDRFRSSIEKALCII